MGIVGKWMLEIWIFWGVDNWNFGVLDVVGKWMLEVWVVGIGVDGSEILGIEKKCEWKFDEVVRWWIFNCEV